MRVRNSSGQTSAIATIVTVVFSGCLSVLPLVLPFNSAQAAVDLQRLLFYPVPLNSGISISTNPGMVAGLALDDGRSHTSSHAAKADAAVVARFQQNIARIRDNEGPYADALIGELVGLGQLYQQSNQHEEALQQLDRAAQISRINNGLYGDDQVALAEYMIESLLALGRFDEVEDKYRFMVAANENQRGASVAQKAAALLKLGEWKLESFHRNLARPDSGQMQSAVVPVGTLGDQAVVNTRFGELKEAQTLFVEAIGQLIESESWTDPTLFALEHNLVRTFYIDANREQVIANPASYAISDESSHERMRRSAATLKLSEQYQQGVAAYRRMIGYLKKNPDATIEAVAGVMQGLGDWHLLFGKQSEAEAQYQQLEKFLQLALAPAEQVDAILQPELPVSLPAFLDSPIAAKPLVDDMHFKGYVDFVFDVKRQGRVGKLEVLGSSEGTDSSITDKLVHLVKQARFRPVPGGTTTSAVRYYYVY